MAGLFDGEGCIHINKHIHKMKNGTAYNLLCQIKMCDGRILHELHKIFGGKLTLVQRSLKNPKHSDILCWRIYGIAAKTFLEDILPYLKLKQKQAKVAISFQNKMPLHGRGKYPVTEVELNYREYCYNELRDLKVTERKYRLL